MMKICGSFCLLNDQEVSRREIVHKGKKYIEIKLYDRTHWAKKVAKVILAVLGVLTMIGFAFPSVRSFYKHAFIEQFKFKFIKIPIAAKKIKSEFPVDKRPLKELSKKLDPATLHTQLISKGPPVQLPKLVRMKDPLTNIATFLTAKELHACSQMGSVRHIIFCKALENRKKDFAYLRSIHLIPSVKSDRWKSEDAAQYNPSMKESMRELYSEQEQQVRFEKLKKWLKYIPKEDINLFWSYRNGMVDDGATLLLWTIRYQKNPLRRLHIVQKLLSRGAHPGMKYTHPYGQPGNILQEAKLTGDAALAKLIEGALKSAGQPPAGGYYSLEKHQWK